MFGEDPERSVQFHEASHLSASDWDELPHTVRHRVLRYFHRQGLLERHVTDDMLTWQASGGFSIDASELNRDRHREILERLIASQDGRILQFYGDGTLSVFQSAIAAVHCAIKVQTELRSGDDLIPLRIGLHTGDIVHDDGGVYGDGVNVASRIEGLGVAGAVLISEKVFDEVSNQLDIQTQGLGQFNLKNEALVVAVHQPLSRRLPSERGRPVVPLLVDPWLCRLGSFGRTGFSWGVAPVHRNVGGLERPTRLSVAASDTLGPSAARSSGKRSPGGRRSRDNRFYRDSGPRAAHVCPDDFLR